MDYKDLEKGRRRNWDALKPEDVRKQEKQAEKDKRREEREAKGEAKTSYIKMRQEMRDRLDAEDKEQYRRVILQAGIVVGGFFLLIVLFYSIKTYIRHRAIQEYQDSLVRYEEKIVDGQVVNDLSTPISALASWRSAWREKNWRRLVDCFSENFVIKLSKDRDKDRIAKEYVALEERGGLENEVGIVDNFLGAELLHVPTKPWGHNQLALFRSHPLQMIGDPPPGKRYIAAFAYNGPAKEWRFADMRQEDLFSVKWKYEPDIKPISGGPNAIRYDEKGAIVRPNRDTFPTP